MWGATPAAEEVWRCRNISIHAPRVGSDSGISRRQEAALHFNPRSPCGERPQQTAPRKRRQLISIHAPRVGSDSGRVFFYSGLGSISIHAPRVGSDTPGVITRGWAKGIFQSTLPVWGATVKTGPWCLSTPFQSTLPVWGATNVQHLLDDDGLFQSTLPVWGATAFSALMFM